MSKTYQKAADRAEPDPSVPGEIAVPEEVIVSMAEIAGGGEGGHAGAGLGTDLQVMAAMFDRDVTKV